MTDDELAIHHDGSGRYVQPCDGADPRRLRVGDRVRLRMRAAPEAPVERVFLRTMPDGEQQFEALRPAAPGPACQWWETDLRRVLREGRRPNGTRIDPFMPWKTYAAMTDDEISAIWAYLRSVPAKPFGNK